MLRNQKIQALSQFLCLIHYTYTSFYCCLIIPFYSLLRMYGYNTFIFQCTQLCCPTRNLTNPSEKYVCSKPCNCDILVLNDLVQRREDVSPRTAHDDGQHVCDDDGCDGSQTLLYSSGCLTQILKYGSFGGNK